MKPNNKHISKYLSLVLRHQPDTIGITLDENGWTSVIILLEKLRLKFKYINLDILEEVVATNDKKRFAFNEDKSLIRANQGHSVNIDLGYTQKEPPAFLYHGTVPKFMLAIKEKGLLKMSRHHVHLSADTETAFKVGTRRGVPTILSVNAKAMHEDGIAFYQSDNGVWLTEHVAAKYIEL
jgi:putative RNA 2'-phosphotransferase